MANPFWTASIPVYVTRPHGADKETGCYAVSGWVYLLIGMLLTINLVVWPVIGLIKAAGVLF